MNIKILLEKIADDQYVASVPALDEFKATAPTREEALHNISEAIESYFESKFAGVAAPKSGEIIELAI